MFSCLALTQFSGSHGWFMGWWYHQGETPALEHMQEQHSRLIQSYITLFLSGTAASHRCLALLLTHSITVPAHSDCSLCLQLVCQHTSTLGNMPRQQQQHLAPQAIIECPQHTTPCLSKQSPCGSCLPLTPSLLSILTLWCVQLDEVINAQDGQRSLSGKLQHTAPTHTLMSAHTQTHVMQPHPSQL